MPRCGSGGSGVSGGGGYISPLCCWKGIQWLLGGTRPPYRRFQAYSSSFLFDKPPRIRPISWGIICIHKSSPLTAFHFSILKILHPRPLFFVRLVPPPLPPIEPLGQVFVPGRSYCCVAVTGASPGYKPLAPSGNSTSLQSLHQVLATSLYKYRGQVDRLCLRAVR